MKFTSEDLLKSMGLQVGDRVKATFETPVRMGEKVHNEDWIVNVVSNVWCNIGIEHDDVIQPITKLIDLDFEILPRPKKVGDLKCKEINCRTCPIRIICLEDRHISNSLYFNLELYNNDQCINFDQEIYNLLKARLDKEVQDNE